ARLLEREQKLPLPRVLALASQVCDALAAAHALGIVHRDLKPSNVFVLEGDFVKVFDFGIAVGQGLHDTRLTRTGSFFGSPGWVSPEVLKGQPGEPRSDLYALGALLHRMATGRDAFEAGSDVELVVAQL